MSEEVQREFFLRETKAALVDRLMLARENLSNARTDARVWESKFGEIEKTLEITDAEVERQKQLAEHYADRCRELSEAVFESNHAAAAAHKARRIGIAKEVRVLEMAEERRSDNPRPRAMTVNFEQANPWEPGTWKSQ